MQLHEITARAGAKRPRKRVGRGEGSGLGKTSGRGSKGRGQRAGATVRPGYEGGQVPLYRRFPKFGFSNAPFTVRYEVLNLGTIDEVFEAGATVNLASLKAKGLANGSLGRIKILGEGDVTKSLTFVVDAASTSAKDKIAKAGGTLTIIPQKKYVREKVKSPAKQAKAAAKAKAAPKPKA